MSKEKEDFITWLYRGFIGFMLSVTFLFVKSNYEDFNEMKKDSIKDKTEHIAFEQTLQNHTGRITFLEQKIK